MKNNTPQAIDTLYRIITITHPPNCPIKLTNTKTVAKNIPQPHDIFMYSLCSYHWNHIRKPSSRKVEIRHNRATVGSIYFPFRIT